MNKKDILILEDGTDVSSQTCQCLTKLRFVTSQKTIEFKEFIYWPTSRPALGPTDPSIQWVLGGKGDQSPPCNAEVWNGWSCNSAPHICLHGVHRDIFTFLQPSIFQLQCKHFRRKIKLLSEIVSSK